MVLGAGEASGRILSVGRIVNEQVCVLGGQDAGECERS